MKFATALTLALVAPVNGLIPGLSSFFQDEDDDVVIQHTHEWCCTDSLCYASCEASGLEFGADPTQLPQCVPNNPTNQQPCDGPGELPCCSTEFTPGFTYNEVYNNVDGAGAMFCEKYFHYCGGCRPTAIVCADPHFKRWNGEWYDFHGECDLNFIQAPNFAKGLGMDVTIRTKQRHGYSFIETAAMRIGDDVLEVSSWAEYKLNGVSSANLDGAHLGPFEIEYTYVNAKEQVFNIKTDSDQTIQMKTFKDFVDVKFDQIYHPDFVDAKGMLGSYPHGNMTARDGATVMEDPNEYAMEWQVRASDPQLFSIVRAPQHPVQCILPTGNAAEQRRLGENGVTHEQAAEACKHWDSEHMDMCVFDVVATGDMEMAAAGAY